MAGVPVERVRIVRLGVGVAVEVAVVVLDGVGVRVCRVAACAGWLASPNTPPLPGTSTPRMSRTPLMIQIGMR